MNAQPARKNVPPTLLSSMMVLGLACSNGAVSRISIFEAGRLAAIG
jgi:hypothetical protein